MKSLRHFVGSVLCVPFHPTYFVVCSYVSGVVLNALKHVPIVDECLVVFTNIH
jgi:hypothetical protein